MILKFECSECGEALRIRYEENNHIIKVEPCEECDKYEIEVEDNTLRIGE